ncbi:MAG: Na(+)-translocating NADH-quinone reductase subunit B [Chlamydiae bacterium]|nr:Na(+)-translocating NADH-quinone reductase subunit B [Chlamydiota bacterium]
MLRRLLDLQNTIFEKVKPLQKVKPFASAVDAFCYEVPLNTKKAPFIRDAIDLKRWMVLVVVALLLTILMAVWNTGVQKMVYGSDNYELMDRYLESSNSFSGYFSFTFGEGRWITILKLGAIAFLPIVLVSYLVGGVCEGIIASIRGHEIAEGFLVTGILFPLSLPPTIPLWMVGVGVAFGVVVGKELFGGTGMNILNPALTARAFLFFTFPGKMTGDVWVGTNPTKITQSLSEMNTQAGLDEIDGYSQMTALQGINGATTEIKRIHVETIASNVLGEKVPQYDLIQTYFDKWSEGASESVELGSLSLDQMRAFVTGPLEEGGLGLLPGNFNAAHGAAESIFGLGKFTDGNLFWGNIIGSLGETSTFACLLGALFLVWTGVGAWRTMVAYGIGAFVTAWLFQFAGTHLGAEGGAWNPARYAMPAYRQFIVGSLAFGLVYMATEPVSSPGMQSAKWIYGILMGVVTIMIRLVNPAYPEGVMLAILFGNVFAPLIDYYVVRNYRRKIRRGPKVLAASSS